MTFAPVTQKDLFAKFSGGDAITFAPDPRFKLAKEATVVLQIFPTWKPDVNADKLFGACVLQCGSSTKPGCILDIRVSLDLKSLLLTSSKSDTVAVNVDCSKGASLLLFFGASSVRIFVVKSSAPVQQVDFHLGEVTVGDPQLRLGGDGGNQPYSGLIGGVSLFDRDLYSALQPIKYESDIIVALLEGKIDQFFAAAGRAKEAPFAQALIGLAVLTQKRFDFNPREILWPTGEMRRWMMDNGDQQSVKVVVDDLKDQTEHGIYTTNTVYCFMRMYDQPVLWGDGNQCFLLTYLGNSQFAGHTNPGDKIDRAIVLTYRPDPNNVRKPATMDVQCTNWDNSQAHMFVTRICPQFAKLPSAIHNDTLSPKSFQLKCLPATFNILNNIIKEHPQTWDDAFSTVPFAIGNSMKGWDITKIDDPLNPGGSTAAAKNVEHYLFAPPLGDRGDYRLDAQKWATPYYCAAVDISETPSQDKTTAYRSVSECSHKQSLSLGVGASMGQESLLDCSFESVRQTGTENTIEHSLVIGKVMDFAYAVVLEKQWLQLSSDFLDALTPALQLITSVNVPAPSDQYDALMTVFDKWGTHYPNAITYGSGEYKVGMIDEEGATQMTANSTNNKIAVGIPIEEVLVKPSISWGTENTTKHTTGTKSELYYGLKVGTHHAMPIKMDLRPIVDVLQPPYMADTSALDKRYHIYAAMDQYIAARATPPPDGFVLYQAGLICVMNNNPRPVYVTARAFLAGVPPNSMDIEIPKAEKSREASLVIWHADNLRIEAHSTYQLPPAAFASVAFPLSRTDLAPAVCLTGVAAVPHNVGIGPQSFWTSDNIDEEAAWDRFAIADPFGRNREDPLVAEYYQSVDSLGTDWVSLSGPEKVYVSQTGLLVLTRSLLKEKYNLPALADDGGTQTISMTTNGLMLGLEVRMIDMVNCFTGAASAATAG